MNPSWLPFLANDTLIHAVNQLATAARAARQRAQEDAGRNIIDPFTALFQMQLMAIEPADWPQREEHRQIEKSLQNAIGEFHQTVLGGLTGWENLHTGAIVDLVCRARCLIAEVKNKHNTLKASDQANLYDKLHGLVRKKGQIYAGFTAYYVEIVPKRAIRYDEPFTPSDPTTSQRKPVDPLIRRIDGASFYAFATGYPDALEQLFHAIPQAFDALGMAGIDPKEPPLADYFAAAFSAS